MPTSAFCATAACSITIRRVTGNRSRSSNACASTYCPGIACESTGQGDNACKLLDNLAGGPQPFFLFCSFVEPHTHNSVQSDFKRQFENLPVPPPIGGPASLANKPALQQAYAGEIIARGGKLARDFMAYRRGVYASLNLVDRNIGKILDKLHALGIAEETLILFTSDHGDLMGGFGLIEKTFLYDGAIKVPLIVKAPGSPTGERRRRLASHVDLLPTILERCGIGAWRDMPVEGRDLGSIL